VSALTERAYLGALMHLPAGAVLNRAVVNTDDLEDPRHRVIYGAILGLALIGTDPTPAEVDALLARDATVARSDRAHVVGLLVDLYTETPGPFAAITTGRAVIEDAVRRRIREAGERLLQAADTSPLDGLGAVVVSESAAIGRAIERLAVAPEVVA
jgi:replicative DNA helicase